MQTETALARGRRVAWRILAPYRLASADRRAVAADDDRERAQRFAHACCSDEHPAICALKRRLLGAATKVRYV
jgi:hypothetical protein